MIDKVKYVCENLRSFLDRSEHFKRIGNLQRIEDKDNEFKFDADHKVTQDRLKNVTSGYYDEEVTFYCNEKHIRAKMTNTFEDYFTYEDEHKLTKVEIIADRGLSKDLYEWSTEGTGYDDMPNLFRIQGELNKRFSLDTTPQDIEKKSREVLDNMFRHLEENFFNK